MLKTRNDDPNTKHHETIECRISTNRCAFSVEPATFNHSKIFSEHNDYFFDPRHSTTRTWWRMSNVFETFKCTMRWFFRCRNIWINGKGNIRMFRWHQVASIIMRIKIQLPYSRKIRMTMRRRAHFTRWGRRHAPVCEFANHHFLHFPRFSFSLACYAIRPTQKQKYEGARNRTTP